MKKISRHLTQLFLLTTLSFLLTTACSQPDIQNHHLFQNPAGACRVIQHDFGETCVPLNPERIIALDPDTNLAPLIALGIKPVGYATHNFEGEEVLFGASPNDVTGAASVGNVDQPSIEKIVMLKPDVILATKHSSYQLLSQIAPTVPVPFPDLEKPENKAFFKENIRFVAKIFEREEKAEQVLSQYQNRVEDLKNRLKNRSEKFEISIIFYTQGLVYAPARGYDAAVDILVNLGVPYKIPLPNRKISIETIDEYDSDILFIINLERKTLSFFLKHPIFSQLKAVKTNRAYLVPPERWDTRGILGANQILDDFFRYLLEDG